MINIQGITIEETEEFLPDFGKINNVNSVIPVAVQHFETNEVILIAYTNREALLDALNTKMAVFWSTSRDELWVKGATSGHYFDLVEVYVNCEQNSLVYKVRPQIGGICHTKDKFCQPRNCFYRRLNFETLQLENLNP